MVVGMPENEFNLHSWIFNFFSVFTPVKNSRFSISCLMKLNESSSNVSHSHFMTGKDNSLEIKGIPVNELGMIPIERSGPQIEIRFRLINKLKKENKIISKKMPFKLHPAFVKYYNSYITTEEQYKDFFTLISRSV